MTFAKRVAVAVAVFGVCSLLVGCFQIGGDEPLVRVGDKGYGRSAPSTKQQSDDSDEVQSLKDYAAKLKKKLDDKEREFKDDLSDEKDKRKKVENEKKKMEAERNYWKKRAEHAEEKLEKRG